MIRPPENFPETAFAEAWPDAEFVQQAAAHLPWFHLCVLIDKLNIFKSDGEKTTFAKGVVPKLDAACFEVFRPMFEFIKSKCPARAEGGEVAP